jgi:hypothetical protein
MSCSRSSSQNVNAGPAGARSAQTLLCAGRSLVITRSHPNRRELAVEVEGDLIRLLIPGNGMRFMLHDRIERDLNRDESEDSNYSQSFTSPKERGQNDDRLRWTD